MSKSLNCLPFFKKNIFKAAHIDLKRQFGFPFVTACSLNRVSK